MSRDSCLLKLFKCFMTVVRYVCKHTCVGSRYRRTRLNTASLLQRRVYLGVQTVSVCLQGFNVGPLPHHWQFPPPPAHLALPFYPAIVLRCPAPVRDVVCMFVSLRRVRQEYQSFYDDSSDWFKFSSAWRNSCVASCFIRDVIPFLQ